MLRKDKTAVISVLLTVVFLSPKSFATPQEPDLLVYEGARYFTRTLPSLAECLPDVNLPDFFMLSSANHRGYRATFAVIDGQLYLIGVEGGTISNRQQRLLSSRQLLPTVKFPHKVTSFTGKIEMKGRWEDHIVKEGVINFINKIVIEFKNGKVINETYTTSLKYDYSMPVMAPPSPNKQSPTTL